MQRIIFDATATCHKSFIECQNVKLLMEDEWAENRLADFNLWASRIGALVLNRASLDARLALKTEARTIIAEVLWMLKTAVEECIVLAQSTTQLSDDLWENRDEEEEHRGRSDTLSPQQPSQRAFSPWSDDTNSDSQSNKASSPISHANLSQKMRSVEKILDQLARIAVTIRQSGTRSRLQKADRIFNPEDHQDLRDHLIAVMLSQGPFSAEYTFSPEQINLSKLTPVQLRLINCNLKRRNRFLYAQKHSQALNAPSTKVIIDEEKSSEQPKPDSHPRQQSEKSTPSITKPKSLEKGQNPSVITGTSASGVTERYLLPQNPVPSQAATTQMSTTVMKLDYPRPPKIHDDALLFRCPCCCQALPAIVSDKNRWKKHLAEDICPYSCILPNCSKPETLYITKEAWSTHLLDDHQSVEYWVCFACVDNIQFDQEDFFVAHILQSHENTISKDQIPMLKSTCKLSVPAEVNSCPLCQWPTTEEDKIDRAALIDHIAEEIHSFSLKSLPWAPDDDYENRNGLNLNMKKVLDWLKTDEPSPAVIHKPLHPTKTAQSSVPHYFDLNDYFMETIESTVDSIANSDNTMNQELKYLQEQGPLVYSDSAGRSASSNQTADIRRSRACLPCRISKIRCHDSGICPTCRKAFPDHSHLVCTRSTPAMAWPVMGKVPDIWSTQAKEEEQLCSEPKFFTGNPKEISVFFTKDTSSPSLRATVQGYRTQGSTDERSLNKANFPRDNVPSHQVLQNWVENQIRRDSTPDFQHAVQSFLLAYSEEGWGLPKHSLVSKVHKMNCFFRILKAPSLWCLDPSNKLTSLPLSVQAQLRNIARKGLYELEHDVLKELDDCLAQQGPLKPDEKMAFWASMWQLILMYRELMGAFKAYLFHTRDSVEQGQSSTQQYTYKWIADSFFPLLTLFYHYQFRTKKSLEMSMDWLKAPLYPASACQSHAIHLHAQQLIDARKDFYISLQSSQYDIDELLCVFVVNHELKKFNAQRRTPKASIKTKQPAKDDREDDAE